MHCIIDSKLLGERASTCMIVKSLTTSDTSTAFSVQNVQLKVLVTAQDEPPQAFHIHPNTPLRRVFQAFCLQRGFSMSASIFLLDGCVLCNGTAEQNDLESGDVIEHFPKQAGD